MHGHNVQSEIEILAEGAVAIGGFQVAVGSGDYAHVHRDVIVAAHRTNFLFLQDAQKLGLHFEGQLANFIEEDRAAMRGLEESRFCFCGAGERTFFVAEKLAFHQRWNQRTAIDSDEGRLRHGAAKMNGACHQFLSGAALARNQHRSARVLQAGDHAQDVLDVG